MLFIFWLKLVLYLFDYFSSTPECSICKQVEATSQPIMKIFLMVVKYTFFLTATNSSLLKIGLLYSLPPLGLKLLNPIQAGVFGASGS